jgi:F-type H+-transporting ATPase subunit b
MRSERFVRRAALATMGLLTIAALWGWALPARGDHEADRKASRSMGSTATAAAPGKPADGDSAENETPAPMNWTDFASKTPPFVAVLLNFAILAAAYYWLGKKPIAAALQNRRDSIAKDIEEAQRAKAAAEQRATIYQAKLEKLEDEVRAVREALVRAGEAERERIVSEAEAKAERLRGEARFLIEQELKQLKQDLWREAVEAAVAGAQELLAARVTPADQERLAEDYLASLETHKSAPAGDSRPPEATS